MKTIVLIHGAWHGAWCWKKLIPFIEAKGRKVITPEISWEKIRPQTSTDNTVCAYVQELCDLIDVEQNPVILAAHSMGGMVVSQIAELIPERIDTLVYISGFMLKNGQCIKNTEDLMSTSLIQPNLKLSADKKHLVVPENILREGFYADCKDDDIKFATLKLTPQPLTSFMTPVNLTQENFGRVRRIYIECLQDMAIPLFAQRKMYADMGCDIVHTLNSSHSPFFSNTEKLAKLLTNI